ncbi:MAG: LysM domain-containing protein [Allosphingosinicella sp.]
MNDPQGRYASSEVKVMVQPDGTAVTYIARRTLPEPEGMTMIASVPVEAKDRLDLIAARVLGVATAWWRIADANRAIDPETLETPVGRRLDIPLPEAGS